MLGAMGVGRGVGGRRVPLRGGGGVAGGARRNAAAYSLPPGKLVGGTDGQRGDFKENQIELGELGPPPPHRPSPPDGKRGIPNVSPYTARH